MSITVSSAGGVLYLDLACYGWLWIDTRQIWSYSDIYNFIYSQIIQILTSRYYGGLYYTVHTTGP